MATDALSDDSLQALPLELHPNIDHLVTEDDTPVDNVFSEKQQRLLTEPLYSSWTGAPDGVARKFVAMSNVGLFYHLRRPPLVPDMLLSMDVEVPAEIHLKQNRSYFVWEYGKPPDAVIEVVSNREGGEDAKKLEIYARIGVRYYAIYDPDLFLSDEVLRVYRLEAMEYHKISEPYWFSGVGLGLRLWEGVYEDFEARWLRWFDANGALVATGREGKAMAEARAESAEVRAESAEARAERLAEQLRQLGVEPSEG
jgi:Uma2 family endonuclease